MIHMKIGIPKEIKEAENRVGATPANVKALVSEGHEVVVETDAGQGIGASDDDYKEAGAEIVDNAEDVWAADMVVKVKEPIKPEYKYFREDLMLYTYLHLANPELEELTTELRDNGVKAIAYETVEEPDGTLPLLEPMSEIAGKLGTQVGAQFLQKHEGGRGILMGGALGTDTATVVVLGAGTVGRGAAKVALGMGADTIVLNRSLWRLGEFVDSVGLGYPGKLTALKLNQHNLEKSLKKADVAVGAILVPGTTAPTVVNRDLVKKMKDNSVIVDVSIDQGGIFETSRGTTHEDPTYVEEGVVHYCVTNMPGAVPRTSTIALTNSTMPYAIDLANKGFENAVNEDPVLAKGVNVYKGKITYEPVAKAHGLKYTPLEKAMA